MKCPECDKEMLLFDVCKDPFLRIKYTSTTPGDMILRVITSYKCDNCHIKVEKETTEIWKQVIN
jgi:hypothetical protein